MKGKTLSSEKAGDVELLIVCFGSIGEACPQDLCSTTQSKVIAYQLSADSSLTTSAHFPWPYGFF